MTTIYKWYGPFGNPFQAVRYVAADNGIEPALVANEVRKVVDWPTIEPNDDVLGDLLQEIAGATNIVVQWREGAWHAAVDD